MKWNDDKTITITPPAKPKKITGTRFAAIMGLNKWTSPFNAWCAITRTYEEPFEDCHVAVDCILPSGKRVMFDPTYHLYFTDEKGEYVSIERLRHILLNEEKLTPNEGAVYTGNKSELDMGFYRWYMSKNTVRFEKGRTNSDGNDEWERMILFSKN